MCLAPYAFAHPLHSFIRLRPPHSPRSQAFSTIDPNQAPTKTWANLEMPILCANNPTKILIHNFVIKDTAFPCNVLDIKNQGGNSDQLFDNTFEDKTPQWSLVKWKLDGKTRKWFDIPSKFDEKFLTGATTGAADAATQTVFECPAPDPNNFCPPDISPLDILTGLCAGRKKADLNAELAANFHTHSHTQAAATRTH